VPLDDKLDRDANRSFFSGHASHTAAFSFFMAKVIHDYHKNAKRKVKRIIWISAATIPMFTSYLRVKAGKHFPTDVITGYIVGASVGFLIPHLHKKKATEKRTAQLMPILSPGYSGVSLTIPLGTKK